MCLHPKKWTSLFFRASRFLLKGATDIFLEQKCRGKGNSIFFCDKGGILLFQPVMLLKDIFRPLHSTRSCPEKATSFLGERLLLIFCIQNFRFSAKQPRPTPFAGPRIREKLLTRRWVDPNSQQDIGVMNRIIFCTLISYQRLWCTKCLGHELYFTLHIHIIPKVVMQFEQLAICRRLAFSNLMLCPKTTSFARSLQSASECAYRYQIVVSLYREIAIKTMGVVSL